MLLGINMSQNQNVINIIKEMNQVTYPVQVTETVFRLPADFIINIDDYKTKIIVISNYQNLLRLSNGKATGYLVQCYDLYECRKIDGSKITGAFKVSNVVVAYSIDELDKDPLTSVKRIIEIADRLNNSAKEKDVLHIRSGYEIFVVDEYERLPEFHFTPIYNVEKQYGGKVNVGLLVYKLPMIEASKYNFVLIQQTDFIPLFYSHVQTSKPVIRLEFNGFTISNPDDKHYLHTWTEMIYNNNDVPVEAMFINKEEEVKTFNGSEKLTLEPKTLYLFLEIDKKEKD